MADLGLTLTGLEALAANLERLGADAPLAVAEGLNAHAEAVMTESKTVVPVDTGTLRASGFVAPPVIAGPEVSVTLGYGGAAAAYALPVHENPRSGHTGGVSPQGRKYRHWAQVGGWKYLEGPLNESAQAMPEAVADAVRRRVDGR